MKYLDMYGQPIQFKYKNSPVYATTCGLITSFFVVAIIIIYIVLYAIDVSKMDLPTVLNVPVNLNPSPKYEFFADWERYFNENADYPDLLEDEANKGYLQLMIGLKQKSKNQWVDLNSVELVVEINNEIKNGNTAKTVPLFFDKCKHRIAHLDSKSGDPTIFEHYDLSNVYCIYSDFQMEGDFYDDSHSYVTISLSPCHKEDQNPYKTKMPKCKEIKKLSDLESYQTFKNNKGTSSIFDNNKWTAYQKEDTSDATDTTNGKQVNYTDYDFYFMYINTVFNQTSMDHPIRDSLEWKSIEIGDSLMSSVNAYFQKNKLTTFTKIIPKSMTNSNTSEYYVSFDNDKYSNTPGTLSDDLIKITIKSSDRVNQYERSYTTIFDILGKIGGLSKIILLIGGIFVVYSSSNRLKESLINDFYSVIDPENTPKINKEFSVFLKEVKENQGYVPEYKTYDQDPTIKKKEEYLRKFFAKKADKLLDTESKLDKDIDLKDKAEYNIAKIVYGLYQNLIYSGLHYTTCEMMANFCFCCCVSRRLKRKNAVFNKAVKALHKDTDFVSILECVQNFENIKATFLKRETQLALFKALANKPFASFIKSGEETPFSKDKPKRETNTQEDYSENNGHFLEDLYSNLLSLVNENKSMEEFELDKNLVYNLVDEKYRNEGDALIKIISELIEKNRDKSKNKKKEDVAQKLELTKEDLEKINKKFE